jgi:hypothetical protein
MVYYTEIRSKELRALSICVFGLAIAGGKAEAKALAASQEEQPVRDLRALREPPGALMEMAAVSNGECRDETLRRIVARNQTKPRVG